jgi:DNA polymerase I
MQKDGEVVGRGKMISYVVLQGKGPIYERVALPGAATIDKLDMEYYVNNQLIPVVDSIFQVFGYKKEDFSISKAQTGLGQFF